MVLEYGSKVEAAPGAAMDQLLEEYLRVINDKDDQLHRLLRQLEDQQVASRQSDEAHKAHLKDLTQQLHRREAKLRDLQQQCASTEELHNKLVHHTEALKLQLQASVEKVQRLEESALQMSENIQSLDSTTSALRSTVTALEAQRERESEALASAQQLLNAEKDTSTTLRGQCQTLTQALEERQSQVEQLQAQVRGMVNRSEHTAAVQALENAAAAARAQSAHDLDRVQQQLLHKNEELLQSQQSLRSAQSKVAELTDALDTASTALHKAHQELSATAMTAQQTVKEMQNEVSRRKVAQQGLAERVGELERALAREHDSVQRTSAELQATQLQYERYKAGTEKALEADQTQLRGVQEQLRQTQEEVDVTRRRLEAKERAASDGADAALRLREQLARVEAESRERVATLTAASSAKSSDCDRLQAELKKVQSTLLEAQQRTTADERALNLKFEELQAAVHRLQSTLRDKEEETRRLELVHSSEVHKMKSDFASATEEMRRRHETEVRELNGRIERFRGELGEQAGGSKGLERELKHLDEARREMRREMDRLQNALDAKEAALQSSTKELEKQQAEAAQLTQRLAVREREEVAMRQRLEEAERVQLDWRATAERAQDTVAVLKKAAESTAASIAAMDEQQAKRDAVIAGLRREVEELLEARQTALRETMQQKAQREQVALKLAGTEERLATCESELRDAVQERKKLQRTLDECKAELRCVQDEVGQRNADCTRLTKHAEEVEELAKRTADDLHRSLEAREDTIRQLRSEQATVLPQLNEERGKSLVLQERLQHLQEVHHIDAETAKERMRVLEADQAAREADVVVLRAEKAHLEQQIRDATAQADSLRATLDGREHKYQQRKEEVQKALRQVEEVKVATTTALQEAEAQSAAANALRDKYKKEKAKMEALLQRMEHKAHDSAKAEREGRKREASLVEKLKDAETALRRVQDSMESRIGDAKLHYDELCRQQEESFREAASDVQAAEKQANALQAQLLEARRRATLAESSLRELQRQSAARQMLAAEEYAEEATDLKRAHMDAVLRAHRAVLSYASCFAREGWSAAQRTVESSRFTAVELERQLTRMEAKHKAELQAVNEAHARQREAAAAEHREVVARLQRKAAEVECNAASQLEEFKRTDADRDQRCRALEDSMERLRTLLDMEKEQAAAFRQRVTAEEVTRSEAARVAQEERRALQRSHDKLKRQLGDRAVEQQHNEDELREQRAEVAALQRVLAEKDREHQQELQRLREDAEKTPAAIAARDAAMKQCEELRQQVDFVRGQLESARASHQRVLNEQHSTQRTRDARLEAAQAELATVAAERRRLQADLSHQEQRLNELEKEVQALQRQKADAQGQLQARKSEISALRERCANLESLKNISDATLAETQTRERSLMEKIEELRNAQQLMQLCFDKQQEQLEIGKRLRQRDAQMRARYSP
ncbi:basal body component putative ML protein [Leptomonas seymouri]|uniref:Basal body component putative ML protein n=1 Tax=Leptomonas seymouri TaxID=5684 RepID=A0A0N1PAZ8_LEPSE|nr:basal body component putative ML protein [Leptomonas seymouri]|eukprot:KPI84454.1 basal body component putative ML protein [Leptomonas seymouri]